MEELMNLLPELITGLIGVVTTSGVAALVMILKGGFEKSITSLQKHYSNTEMKSDQLKDQVALLVKENEDLKQICKNQLHDLKVIIDTALEKK